MAAVSMPARAGVAVWRGEDVLGFLAASRNRVKVKSIALPYFFPMQSDFQRGGNRFKTAVILLDW